MEVAIISKLIDNYLSQERVKEQNQRNNEQARQISLLLEFADQMDKGEVVHYSDVSEKLTDNGYTNDISVFHVIALTRNAHYIYYKKHGLLSKADNNDLRKNQFYKIIAKVQICFRFLFLTSLITSVGALIVGTFYALEDILKIFIIVYFILFVDVILLNLTSEYSKKYELYGITNKKQVK